MSDRTDMSIVACFLARALVEAESAKPLTIIDPDGRVAPTVYDPADGIVAALYTFAAAQGIVIDRSLAVGEWAPRP
jgi:hypothetical protein